jgi:hypothetical protein
LQARVREELLEVLGAVPLVLDQDEAVADCEIVELAYFGGLSFREAAQAAGIPEGTAKSRLRLALAKLKTVLDASLLESP